MDKPKIKTEEKLFDCGVNDVVTGKQTANRVLTRRIKAHLNNTKCPSLLLQNNSVRLKDTIVDFERREVLCNGKIHELPGLLGDLLKYFIDNPKSAISREELLNSPIWSDSICSSATDGGKTFDVNIGKLRKIIEPDPSKPQIIISVRGVGWKLAPDVAEQIEKG
jgi:DNA-binding response OmpR family regulator